MLLLTPSPQPSPPAFAGVVSSDAFEGSELDANVTPPAVSPPFAIAKTCVPSPRIAEPSAVIGATFQPTASAWESIWNLTRFTADITPSSDETQTAQVCQPSARSSNLSESLVESMEPISTAGDASSAYASSL